ncbi:MAG: hypothetical protein Q8Q08_09010 [Candidatus Omnitrophota bacterium]|nr:hypothetical protein [Candidatus Omnitrophota bacterium]MDZ4242621.1 hypothetical protein [Candidatus Omnitrophota bacterium]
MKKENVLLALLSFLFLVQISLFLYVNTLPILYQQGEMIWQNIFWSLDPGQTQPAYHTGVTKNDFAKIFMPSQIDYLGFRLRHVSYLADMLGFKFWQFLGVATFHNYTHSLIHLLNTILLGLTVVRLTGSRLTGYLAACFFLNSATAISTLLFPFRSAKLVVVTGFLLSCLWIATQKGRWRLKDTVILAGLLVLTVLSDETSVFLLPAVFGLAVLKSPEKTTWRNPALPAFWAAGGICALLLGTTLMMSRKAHDPLGSVGYLGDLLRTYLGYFSHAAILTDTFQAAGLFFLRRNLGYWDASAWGLLAGAASLILAYVLLRIRADQASRNIAVLLLAVILIKALFLPHPSGLHEYIMPPGAVFPSLLFFSHYYPYPDIALLAMALGLLSAKALQKNRNIFLVLLTAVTCIGMSNVSHSGEGVTDAIRFHQDYWIPAKTGRTILDARKRLDRRRQEGAVYLSFPSGSSEYFTRYTFDPAQGMASSYPEEYRAGIDPSFRDYASILPVMYLRAIEKGTAVISLKNAGPEKIPSGNEMEQARFFLDVPTGHFFDLADCGWEARGSRPARTIRADSGEEIIIPDESMKIIIFVKGPADVLLRSAGRISLFRQTYGNSFQMFRLHTPVSPFPRSLRLTPRGKSAEVVGPCVPRQ